MCVCACAWVWNCLVLGSQSAPSLAVSRLEQVLSEGSAVSSIQRHGPAHIWTTLERIWLQAGKEHITTTWQSHVNAQQKPETSVTVGR